MQGRIVRALEIFARAAALALIAFAIWRTLAPRNDGEATIRLDSVTSEALAAVTTGPPRRVQLALHEVPTVTARDWLVALRRAGTPIAWWDAALAPPVAITVSHAADPVGGVTIAIAARDSTTLGVADALGVIDSITPASHGARISASAVQGSVRLEHDGRSLGGASAPVPRALRPVLVSGSAGWEAKFIIAALEERGWTVHSRIRVSPTALVSQGRDLPLDTARYAAVILLDSTTSFPASAILRYVRSGGGLILAGDANRIPTLAGIAPARPGEPIAGSLLRSASAAGRNGLALVPLASLRSDAVEIDQRDGHVVVAARREGAGRVIAVGESESWRWRMTGGDDAPADHRAWWSHIVASAAYAPLANIPATDPEAAPYAALIDALGAPVAELAPSPTPPAEPLPWWLGISILALLLAEWFSRRLRGAR